jgi:hypothetical protein
MAEQNIEAADPLDANDIEAARQLEREDRETALTTKQAALRARRDAYVRLFAGNPMGNDHLLVLADLKRFCRGDVTPWDTDARVHALLTGRFEVYNRVMLHTQLSFDALWTLLEGSGYE